MKVLKLLATANLLLLAVASADSVTWSFSGHVTDVLGTADNRGSVAVNDTISGLLTFDPTVIDTAASSSVGSFQDSIMQFQISFGSGDFIIFDRDTSGGLNRINIDNDNAVGYDVFQAFVTERSSPTPLTLDTSFTFPDELNPEFGLAFSDYDGAVFSDDGLVSTPPSISDLELAIFRWDLYSPTPVPGVNNGSIRAQITSLSAATPAAVPVPPAAGIGLLGLGLVGFMRRRKRRA